MPDDKKHPEHHISMVSSGFGDCQEGDNPPPVMNTAHRALEMMRGAGHLVARNVDH